RQAPLLSPVGMVRKHDERGNELWSRRFEGNPLSGVAVDAAGGVYVVGPTQENEVLVIKLSSRGNQLWTRQLGRGRGAVVAADTSGIYMAWTPAEGPRQGVVLRKYTAEGDVLWTEPSLTPAAFEFSYALSVSKTGVYLSSSGSVDFLE